MQKFSKKCILFFGIMLTFPILTCQNREYMTFDQVEKDDLSGKDFSYKEMIGFDLSNKNLRTQLLSYLTLTLVVLI